ncbi:kinase-like protein [Neoconidiobolus thromboides FSU 785]|nr:kinase-like protein [Neoconidiobolus thromboides FSU 785]
MFQTVIYTNKDSQFSSPIKTLPDSINVKFVEHNTNIPTPNLSPDISHETELVDDKEAITPTSASPIIFPRSPLNPDLTNYGYNIIKLIGQGAFAKVYLGQRKSGDQKVAIKMMIKNQENHAFFNKEVDCLKKYQHPNIVKLIDSFITDEHLVIVQEYLADGDLFDFINNNLKLSKSTVSDIFQQCVQAVHYLHKNDLAHRDIKLENFLLMKQKDRYIVKLTDFGLSINTLGNTTLNVSISGSEEYLMPELLVTSSKGHDLRKGDSWALGCILYALTYGHLPYHYGNGVSRSSMFRKIALGELNFPSDTNVDPNLKQNIKGLLKLNANHRIKLEQFL